MSVKTHNRLRLAREIQRLGSLSFFPCDYCASIGHDCLVMDSRPKCAECTRRGRPCVGVSWESLDRARSKLRRDIRKTNKESAALAAQLAALTAKAARLQQTLDDTERRASQKADCLAMELGSDNDGTEDETGPPDINQIIEGLPNEFWQELSSPSDQITSS